MKPTEILYCCISLSFLVVVIWACVSDYQAKQKQSQEFLNTYNCQVLKRYLCNPKEEDRQYLMGICEEKLKQTNTVKQ